MFEALCSFLTGKGNFNVQLQSIILLIQIPLHTFDLLIALCGFLICV